MLHYFYFLFILQPPRSTLFPYTTLFRSLQDRSHRVHRRAGSLRFNRKPRLALRRAVWGFVRSADGDRLALDSGKRSEEHTSELQSRLHLVCRLLLEKKKSGKNYHLTLLV